MNSKVNYMFLTLEKQKNGRMPSGKNRSINLYRVTRKGLIWVGVEYFSTIGWRGSHIEAIGMANKFNGNRLTACKMGFKSKNHTMNRLACLY